MPTKKTSSSNAAAGKASAAVADMARGLSPSNTSKPFFPYARYTSLVGVHISLLAFTAIYLPRGAFADLSSPAVAATRQKRDAIVMLTENPARTVAWFCMGTLLLQFWWASWVRDWKLEASVYTMADSDKIEHDEAKKAERILRQKEWSSQTARVCSLPRLLPSSMSIHPFYSLRSRNCLGYLASYAHDTSCIGGFLHRDSHVWCAT